MASAQHVSLTYFGKVPQRGDFVKASDQVALLQVMDQWLSNSMQLLVQDVRWRVHYDAMPNIHFAFMKIGSPHVVVGTLLKSLDSAERRFPFMLLCTIDHSNLLSAVTTSPLRLASTWKQLYSQANHLLQQPTEEWGATELVMPLNGIPTTSICQNHLDDYLHLMNFGELQRLLTDSGFQGDLRQAVIAMGLLLQPMLSAFLEYPEKSLILPLPNEPMHRDFVASFWLRMITPFLKSSDMEMSLMLTQFYSPVMVIGFSGASAQQLVAIISPTMRADHCIHLEGSEWVETQIEESFTLNKFSLYLQQPELSLHSVLDLFEESFLGS